MREVTDTGGEKMDKHPATRLLPAPLGIESRKNDHTNTEITPAKNSSFSSQNYGTSRNEVFEIATFPMQRSCSSDF